MSRQSLIKLFQEMISFVYYELIVFIQGRTLDCRETIVLGFGMWPLQIEGMNKCWSSPNEWQRLGLLKKKKRRKRRRKEKKTGSWKKEGV